MKRSIIKILVVAITIISSLSINVSAEAANKELTSYLQGFGFNSLVAQNWANQIGESNLGANGTATMVALMGGAGQTSNPKGTAESILSTVVGSTNPSQALQSLQQQIFIAGGASATQIQQMMNNPSAINQFFANGNGSNANQVFNTAFPGVASAAPVATKSASKQAIPKAGTGFEGIEFGGSGGGSGNIYEEMNVGTSGELERPKFTDNSRAENTTFDNDEDVAVGADPFIHHKAVTFKAITSSDVNDPLDEWNGWAASHEQMQASDIFYTHDQDLNKLRYPQVKQGEEGGSGGWNGSPASIAKMNIGVDEEVRKTQMPVFRALPVISDDLAASKQERNRNLDLFKSIRGISALTLNYLDKTVSAGLNATQSQLDQGTNSHILKQISWATKELTDPAKTQLYSDNDEKIQACLLKDEGTAADLVKRVDLVAKEKELLQQEEFKKTCGEKRPEKDEGLYQYCICLAEFGDWVNTGAKDVNADGYWSLVDRVFFGTKGPESGSGDDNARKIMLETAYQFKQLYGDVIFTKDSKEAKNEIPVLKFLHPALSIDQYVEILINGCQGQSIEAGKNENTCSATMETIPDSTILDSTRGFKGIRPSVLWLLRNWPIEKDKKDEARKYLAEASIGKILYANEITNWFSYSEEQYRVPDDWNPNPRMERFINAFSQGSAVAALEKIHERMKSIVEDHITINQSLSDYQRAQIRTLYGRFDKKFKRVQSELAAQQLVEEQVQLANVHADRRGIGNNANLQQSTMRNIGAPVNSVGGANAGANSAEK